jgi:hypothetical protein
VRGLSATEDMAAFLAAVDLVVSDYSPLIGDAVVADRPVVLYQPDRTLFLARTCGVYPGLSEVGPVVIHQEDLHDEVGRWLGDPAGWDVQWGESRQAWGERWAGPADGRAGERAAAALVAAMRGER